MYGMGYRATGRMAKNIASLGVDPNAANRALRTGAELDQIGDRLNQLELTLDAMWILLERAGYRREDLEAVIEQLDAEDGAVDGQRTPKGVNCRSCGAMVEAGRTSCVFCGKAVS
jgi:hypothetical protein